MVREKIEKILLVNPKFPSFDYCAEPLGLEYIAANLRKNGYEVKIFDFNVGLSMEEFVEILKNFSPDAVGIGSLTTQAENAYELGKLIRKTFSETIIFYGCVHPTFFPEEPFKLGCADFVIRGEGDEVACKLMNYLNEGRFVENIEGLCYRKENEVIVSDKLAIVENLESLPFPAKDLVPLKNYRTDIHILPYAKEVSAEVMTSKGCPNNCKFCCSPRLYGRRLRFRSIQNVLDEVKEIIEKFGIRCIHFHDDNFLIDAERIKEFCEKVEEEKMNFKWICLTNLNTLKMYVEEYPELIRKISESGCLGIEIGIETGDPKVLEAVGKSHPTEMIKEIDKILHQHNIVPMWITMAFNMGENLDSAYLTSKLLQDVYAREIPLVDYLRTIHTPYMIGHFATPVPGSEFFEVANNFGIVLAKTWSDYHFERVNFIPHTFLEDVPTKIKQLSKEEFKIELLKFKDDIEWQIFHTPYLGNFKSYEEYEEFLAKLYQLCDSRMSVKKIMLLSHKDFGSASIGLRLLAQMNFIRSLSDVNDSNLQ